MQEKKKKIVFVCTGNTCRSPMAEAVFRYELRRRKIEDTECFSAGIHTRGESINLKSVSVLIENGLSVENFQSKNLDLITLRSAYLIICMTAEQRDYVMDVRWKILREAGEEEIENNVYAFSDICGYDIPDPYGGDLDVYRKAFSMINAAMPPLFERFFPQKQEEIPPKKKRGRPRKYPEGAPKTKTGTKSTGRRKKTTQSK